MRRLVKVTRRIRLVLVGCDDRAPVPAAGIVAGLAGAVPVSWAMRHQLSGLTGFDPAICLAVVLLVLLVALAALLIPARAAGRVDLSATLREQ